MEKQGGIAMMFLFFTGIFLILSGGIVQMFFPPRLKGTVSAVFTTAGTIPLIALSFILFQPEHSLSFNITLSFPFREILFRIDTLSAFFIMIFAGGGALGTIYGAGYMSAYIGKRPLSAHFFFLSIFIVSLILVVSVSHALAFLVFWEIMSLSSFFLLAFENEKKEVYDAAINYLIAMHISFVFIMTGFILLSVKAGGSYSFHALSEVLRHNRGIADIIFILMLTGFGTKAGFMPFHTWLPKAHPAAPSHISGMMSGIMIKVGIYGIMRIILMTGRPSAFSAYLLLAVALISAVAGIIYAVAQHDIKKLLAYCSVENIGIIGIGIAFGMLGLAKENQPMAFLGFGGAMLHVVNHAIFKGLLFYGAGAVYQQTHTRNIELLGGLAKKMPLTALFFLTGSIAISGIPPFNGFISEFIMYFSMFKGLFMSDTKLAVASITAITGLAFVGVIAFLCFTKAFSVIFLGSPRSNKTEFSVESGKTMLFSMGILALFCLAIGLLPQVFTAPAFAVSRDLMPVKENLFFQAVPLLDTLSGLSIFLFIFISIAGSAFLLRYLLLRKRCVTGFKTWDCGYQAGNSRMQYTASSYATPFIVLFKRITKTHLNHERPAGLFPKDAKFVTHVDDILEYYIIIPAVRGIQRFFGLFAWIQSGGTGYYILYGLLFLTCALLWIMGAK